MKILIVDDHALIREALQGVLKKLKRGVAIVEASDIRQAMDIIRSDRGLNLILLDLNLPDGDGFGVLAELREHYPAIAVAVLSAVQDPAKVKKALELGAVGYIPKASRREVMVGALQLIFAGGVYIPPEILAPDEITKGVPVPRRDDRPIVSMVDVGLSDRQLDVLGQLMQGRNNKMICRVLGLAEPTVKNHITAILKALKVTNRTEAVIAVNELGWKLPANPKT